MLKISLEMQKKLKSDRIEFVWLKKSQKYRVFARIKSLTHFQNFEQWIYCELYFKDRYEIEHVKEDSKDTYKR